MGMLILISVVCVAIAIAAWRKAFATRLGATVAGLAVFFALCLPIAYVSVDALTGNGIDLRVIYQLKAGFASAGVGDFARMIVMVGAATLLAAGVALVAARLSRGSPARASAGRKARIAAGAVLLMVSVGFNPGFADLAGLWNQTRGTSTEVPELFVGAELTVLPERKRNFVLVYAEQLERTYLDQTLFPGLMPELAALEHEALSFVDLRQVPGTEWTIAGMTATLCGVPLSVPGGNGLGKLDRFLPGATCLTDLLAEEGYHLEFIGGAGLEFAGKDRFLTDHGFARSIGRLDLEPLLDDPTYVSWWGIYDDVLLDQAAGRFDALAAEGEPFGLVMLTLDTHQPDGHLSAACEGKTWGDGDNPILNAVHCSDRLLARFIRHIRESAAFDDTVLIVASDHLAMPNTATSLLERGTRRNLALAFAPDLEPSPVRRSGSTLDIGPTLLGLLGADSPGLGFGRDLRKSAPTIVEMDRPPEEILWSHWSFFNSLWAFPTLDAGLRLDEAADARQLALGERRMGLPALFLLGDGVSVDEVAFDDFSLELLPEMVAALPSGQPFVWVDACGRLNAFGLAPPEGAKVCAAVGSLDAEHLPVFDLTDGKTLSAEAIKAALASATPSPEVHAERIAAFEAASWSGGADPVLYEPSAILTGRFGLLSAGFGNGPSRVVNRTLGEGVELARGITLLGLSADARPEKLGYLDTCAYEEVLTDGPALDPDGGIAAMVAANSDRLGAFAVLVHDSAICDPPPDLAALFRGTPFARWDEIGYRTPYVGILDGDGRIAEYVGEENAAVAVDALSFVRRVEP